MRSTLMPLSVLVLLGLALLLSHRGAITAAENPPPTNAMTLRLELFVADVEKSAAFYGDVLGFERLAGQPSYLPVQNGSVVFGLGPASGLPKGHHFNPELQTARRGLGAEIVLEVDDVTAAFRKAQASGYQCQLTPLRKQPWGLTDFRLVDPDGYYLRVTSR